MIQIDDLHTHYGLSHIIQGVALTAAPGEVVGIFGRNGVGKTTLLKAVAGWVRPTSGAIHFAGAAIGGLAPDEIARRGIGFVPEDRRIFPGLSVQENLELGLLQRRGRSRAQEAAALEDVFERFPRLKERRKQLGTTLSGGEQQMLAIGRALVTNPRLLILDEATEGLAPLIREEIWATIRLVRGSGLATLIVDKSVAEVARVADRVVVLVKGEVVHEGPPAALLADRALMHRHLGV